MPKATVTAGAMETELRALYRAYVNLLEVGRDRIVALGGDCDPVDVMEKGGPALCSVRALLNRINTKGDGEQ